MPRNSRPAYKEITTDEAQNEMMRLSDAESMLQIINSEMEMRIEEIRKQYSKAIAAQQEEITEALENLQHYAEANPELFRKKKSVSFPHGVLGFRTSPAKLIAQRGFSWSRCMPLIKEHLSAYVRVKEEVNKDSILEDRGLEGMSALLDKCGLEIVKSEKFYVETKQQPVLLKVA